MKKSSKKTKKDDTGKYQIGRTLPTGGYARKEPGTPAKKATKKRSRRKIIGWIVIILIVLGSVFGFLAWDRIKDVFNGSLFDLIAKNQPLERDRYGRSNIVVFGTSEDDAGHAGATLADSILVISLNQDTKDVNMISIPRDLWIEYSVDCSLGSEGKINAAYTCALEHHEKNEHKASQAFTDHISEVMGTDMQYYAKINYSVVKSVVDSLGGIDVNIESSDPRGIYDPATKIKLTNGTHSIDGGTALDLARSRGAFGGYGLAKSNFDRERNQQAIVKGILNKASSGGTLANPVKVLSVFGSLGDNIISNIETKNIKTVIDIARDINSDNIVSIALDDKEKPLVVTGQHRGVSIVRPRAGIFNYDEIHSAVEEYFKPQIADRDNSND